MSSKDELEVARTKALQVGHFMHAAHLSLQMGRAGEAAELFERGHRFYEAAVAYRESGEASKALRAAMRTPREDSCYFAAARLAIELSAAVLRVDHEFEQFVQRFVTSPIQTLQDVDAQLLLGDLYEATSYPRQAIEQYRRVLSADPKHARARDALDRAQLSSNRTATMEVMSDRRDLPAMREHLGAQAVQVPASTKQHQPPNASAGPREPAGAEALVAERYRLERLLGEGGSAAVYEALDLSLGERVALKLMHPFPGDVTALARFRREVRLARGLTHHNIVRIYDLGEHESRAFLTMELIEGNNLGGYLASQPVDMQQRHRLLLQALDGLAFAHAQKVIHRDIKPENMFVTSNGELKLADFGMAKGESTPSLTMSGVMGGTPAYIAPEQIMDLRSADHRADLYSLGAVAYELFTGKPPFEAESLPALLFMHLEKQPDSILEGRSELPLELDRVVLKLLAKRKEDRFASAVEARDALARVSF